uniref:Glycosyl-4,4'-diaponeurosporenoate acyltransferase n=1 Tax=Caenorhabditis tropicalis TaxID=1561998 RepID=A0A1I7UU63_9PELO
MPMRTISIKKIGKRKAVCEFVQYESPYIPIPVLLLLSNVFFFTIPLFFLVIGTWKFSQCQPLPPWMLLLALLIIIDRLIFWKRLVNETKFEKTFPRPSLIGSMERIKTWEENRVWSSSRYLLGLMGVVRMLIFAG